MWPFTRKSGSTAQQTLAVDVGHAPGWIAVDSGRTIGTHGSEAGIIIADEEHALGARITIERDGDIAPFAIVCGVYGLFFHTRFFATLDAVLSAYRLMRPALVMLTSLDPDAQGAASAAFVDQFPT
jgi:hypothetical protein